MNTAKATNYMNMNMNMNMNNNQYQYHKRNEEEQKSLFETFSKYQYIQSQLDKLSLLSSSSTSSSLSTSSTSTSSTPSTPLTSVETVKQQQHKQLAKQLQLSTTQLSQIILQGKQAKEELLLSNIGLVHFTINKFYSKQITNNHYYNIDDIIQEGMIGLSIAITKFKLDPSKNKNNKFSTYAVYWIKARITRFMKSKEAFIYVPEYIQDVIQKMERLVLEYKSLLDQDHVHCSSSSSGENENDYDELYDSLSTSSSTPASKKNQHMIQYLCQELNTNEKTIHHAIEVRKMMYNTKSVLEFEEWMLLQQKQEHNGINMDTMITSRHTRTSNDVSTASSTRGNHQQHHQHHREEQLEHFKSILGQFISRKEMEALSWRYGLLEQELQQQEQQQQGQKQNQVLASITKEKDNVSSSSSSSSSSSQNNNHCRDYQAEAENDLFGPGGIFSVSSSSSISSLTSTSSTSTLPSTSASASALKNSREMKHRQTSTIRFQSKSTTTTTSTTTKILKGGRWGEAMSFNEVGEQMRVSAEYGRRLCSNGLKKLTKAAEEGRLDPAMLF